MSHIGIFIEDKLFVVVHNKNSWPIVSVLDWYAKEYAFSNLRNKMVGIPVPYVETDDGIHT